MKKIIFTFCFLLASNVFAQKDPVLLPAFNAGKFGYIDANGKLVIDYQYDNANYFSEGLAVVEKTDKDGFYKYAVINTKGKIVIDFSEFYYGYNFSEGLIFQNRDGIPTYIKKNGNTAFSFPLGEFDYSSSFSEGVAVVATKDNPRQYGIINNKGKYLYRLQSDIEIINWVCRDGLLVAVKDKKYGFIDKYGNVKIDFIYDHAANFSEGLAAVVQNGLVGFINTQGSMIIAPSFFREDFYNGYTFSEGVCAVQYLNNNWGYINKSGQYAFAYVPDFVRAGKFNNGKAIVMLDDKGTAGVIDKSGIMIDTLPLKLDMYFFDLGKEGDIQCTMGGKDLSNSVNAYINLTTNKVIWEGDGIQWCFPANTLVKTTDNLNVPINEITPGTSVWSYNPKTKQIEKAKIVNIKIHSDTNYPLTQLVFVPENTLSASSSDNLQLFSIEGTDNHPILTTQGVKKIEDIRTDDLILYFSEHEQKLIKCQVISVQNHSRTVETVYNLILENNNFYIANGVIASPKCPFVYGMQNNEYVYIEEIIKNQMSKKLEQYDYVQIPSEMIENNVLKIKISEEKDEISYLDHLYLQIGDQIIEPQTNTDVLQKIKANDDAYMQLEKEEYIELTFTLPDNFDAKSNIRLIAKGYYLPTYCTK